MGLNNNRKKDNFDDIVVSVKSAAEAEKREVFLNRATDKLSYKKQDKSVAQIENNPPAYESVLLSLAQTGTGVPTAVVLNNDTTIEPAVIRSPLELSPGDLPGEYRVVMTGAFAGKLVRVIPPIDSNGPSGLVRNIYSAGKYDDDSIYLTTGIVSNLLDTSGATAQNGEAADGCLFNGYSFLEIQIWDIPT